MGVDSISKNKYITCTYDQNNPYGRIVNTYDTEEEAKAHIKYQKEHGSLDYSSY